MINLFHHPRTRPQSPLPIGIGLTRLTTERMRTVRVLCGFVLLAAVLCGSATAQTVSNRKYAQEDKFRQLEESLPTPNRFRTASGAPGPDYWQQQANYVIDVELDDVNQRISGSETVTYSNRSPDTLRYLWMQLDPNLFAKDSDAALTEMAPSMGRTSFSSLDRVLARQSFDGGVAITTVKDAANHDLKHTVVKTMMRIELPKPLAPGETFTFRIAWNYAINNSKLVSGRTGYEFFEEDKNYIYEIAQWYPRMAAYSDATGWQHKQYLGRGEFTLEMGDYLVRITAPDDHVVAATGVLLNEEQVLTEEQRERLRAAKTAKEPAFVVTPEEAKANQTTKPEGKKTWIFKADQVRDFAFASSRKFIWDAQGHDVEGNQVMAMSYYPNEAEPLWSKYSTHSIIHTLNVYSRYTFAYPYPVAISVNGPVYGMEYPMICFNGPRPEKDGTYSKRTKYGLISVVIHEVGHNYFPMIVNSDERQWTWMDEGLNTFLQYLSEQEWEDKYPSRRGEPKSIVTYMKSQSQVPIMTNSESILQFGPNAYGKPATALNILRETILGRELFDYAFKEYARRWKFRRPMPADFFRSMEDASGVDLDWFWRGWFYSTDHVDIAIDSVSLYVASSGQKADTKKDQADKRKLQPTTLSQERNKELPKRIDRYPSLKDFYNENDGLGITDADREALARYLKSLSEVQRKQLAGKDKFYVVALSNKGGLVMPIIMEFEFTDGSKQVVRVPAEIWRRNHLKVSKLIITQKEVRQIRLDPRLETADVDIDNNIFPPRISKSRFQLYKAGKSRNEMQSARDAKKKREDKAKKAAEAKKAADKKAAEAKKAAETKKSASDADKKDSAEGAE